MYEAGLDSYLTQLLTIIYRATFELPNCRLTHIYASTLRSSLLLCWGLPWDGHFTCLFVFGIVVIDDFPGKTGLHFNG